MKPIEILKKYNIEVNKNNIDGVTKILNKEVFIIGTSGKLGAGKDTLAEQLFLKTHNDVNEDEVTKHYLSFATALRKEVDNVLKACQYDNFKEVAQKYNVDENSIVKLLRFMGDDKDIYTRTPNTRLSLQYWGTDVRRKQHYNYWVNKTIEFLITEAHLGNSYYVTDARFDNEVVALTDLGVRVIRLEVPEHERVSRIIARDNIYPSYKQLNHLSETSLDNFDFDYVISGVYNKEETLQKALELLK